MSRTTSGSPTILWMDEILHHFETMGNQCLLVFTGTGISIPGFLRWCRISSIHSRIEHLLHMKVLWRRLCLEYRPWAMLRSQIGTSVETFLVQGPRDSISLAKEMEVSDATVHGRNPAPLGNYGKPLLVGICRGIIIPGLLGWCRISSIHSMSPFSLVVHPFKEEQRIEWSWRNGSVDGIHCAGEKHDTLPGS